MTTDKSREKQLEERLKRYGDSHETQLEEWLKRCGDSPVTFRLLFGPVMDELRKIKWGTNDRIEALEARIRDLEARPSVQDKGVWQAGQIYELGDIVSRSGSAWICRASHMAVGDDLSHDHFRLFVKRGRDAR